MHSIPKKLSTAYVPIRGNKPLFSKNGMAMKNLIGPKKN
jgi:hypothetical protein